MIDVEEILSKMNPNQKINYDRGMQKIVNTNAVPMLPKNLFTISMKILVIMFNI